MKTRRDFLKSIPIEYGAGADLELENFMIILKICRTWKQRCITAVIVGCLSVIKSRKNNFF